MDSNKLYKMILAAAVATGAMSLGSLTHATRGDTSVLIEAKYSDLHVVDMTASMPTDLRTQFVDRILLSEPPEGLVVVTLDGRVLFLRKDKNPVVRDLMQKLDGRAGGPGSGDIQQVEGPGGGGTKHHEVPLSEKEASSGGRGGPLPVREENSPDGKDKSDNSKKADGGGRGIVLKEETPSKRREADGPGGGKDSKGRRVDDGGRGKTRFSGGNADKALVPKDGPGRKNVQETDAGPGGGAPAQTAEHDNGNRGG